MRKYNRYNGDSLKKARDKVSHPWLIIGIVLGIIFLWNLAGPFGLWKLHRMKKEQEHLYYSVLDYNKKNAALEEQIKSLKNDKKYQEYVVRRELGWIGDNEILYKFIDQDN